MKDITFGEILESQQALQDKNAGNWTPVSPDYGRSSLLWMVEEVGEVASIIKKKGDAAIMENPAVRAAFAEELCDVLMYFGDVCLCYGISPAELAQAFRKKHASNMQRDYKSQYKRKFEEI